MAYTNKGNIQKYLMIDIDSSFDAQVADWISAAELFINKYTRRPEGFSEPASASAKYYDGDGKSEFKVDEFTTISSLEILEYDSDDVEFTLTEGKDEDYITYPYNDNPKYLLKLMPGAQVGGFYSGKKRIKVTAKWAFDTSVPKDIELAATMLVSTVIEKGLKGGKVTSESLGDYSISFGDFEDAAQTMSIRNLLNGYKIFEL